MTGEIGTYVPAEGPANKIIIPFNIHTKIITSAFDSWYTERERERERLGV